MPWYADARMPGFEVHKPAPKARPADVGAALYQNGVRLMQKRTETHKAVIAAREAEKEENELDGCTFKPSIRHDPNNRDHRDIMERLGTDLNRRKKVAEKNEELRGRNLSGRPIPNKEQQRDGKAKTPSRYRGSNSERPLTIHEKFYRDAVKKQKAQSRENSRSRASSATRGPSAVCSQKPFANEKENDKKRREELAERAASRTERVRPDRATLEREAREALGTHRPFSKADEEERHRRDELASLAAARRRADPGRLEREAQEAEYRQRLHKQAQERAAFEQRYTSRPPRGDLAMDTEAHRLQLSKPPPQPMSRQSSRSAVQDGKSRPVSRSNSAVDKNARPWRDRLDHQRQTHPPRGPRHHDPNHGAVAPVPELMENASPATANTGWDAGNDDPTISAPISVAVSPSPRNPAIDTLTLEDLLEAAQFEEEAIPDELFPVGILGTSTSPERNRMNDSQSSADISVRLESVQ